MTQTRNVSIARPSRSPCRSHHPEAVAKLFGEDVLFEIPDDNGVLPWIRHRSGRSAVANSIASMRAMTEFLTFAVEDVMASEAGAVFVGELASRIKATGNLRTAKR